ncbi:MAG: transposase [Neomegalonema sp.]|nr:transposase [Neomegalonema sp.]
MTFPAERKREALRRIAAGATAREAAGDLRLDERAVYAWVQQAGGISALRAPHRPRVTSAQRADAIALVERGVTVRAAAAEVGVAASTLYKWIYARGVTVTAMRDRRARLRAGVETGARRRFGGAS